jgi:hypothetical protein
LIDHLSARLAVRAERSGAERVLRMAALMGSYLQKAATEPTLSIGAPAPS